MIKYRKRWLAVLPFGAGLKKQDYDIWLIMHPNGFIFNDAPQLPDRNFRMHDSWISNTSDWHDLLEHHRNWFDLEKI